MFWKYMLKLLSVGVTMLSVEITLRSLKSCQINVFFVALSVSYYELNNLRCLIPFMSRFGD